MSEPTSADPQERIRVLEAENARLKALLDSDQDERLQTLSAHRNELEKILDAVPAYIFYKDTQNNILKVNQCVADSLGLEKEAFTNQPSARFYPDEAEAYYADDCEVVRTGKPKIHYVEPILTGDDEKRWVSTSKIPLRNEVGEIDRILVIASDITELKRKEEELLEAKDEADKANRAKSIFLANMSHEIRTPLNSILGLAEVLTLNTVYDPQELNDYCKIIHQSGENLLKLINEILDLSKIESGTVELEQDSFALEELLEDCIQLLDQRARERGNKLVLAMDPQLGGKLVGDRLRLRQMLLNLVSNAIKFTEQGSITIQARPSTAAGPADKQLEIIVTDTGIGVPTNREEAIFESFQQANAQIARDYGGSGLGLSITRQLAALMGGAIHLDTTYQEGARFTLTLPWQAQEPVDPPPAEPVNKLPSLRDRRVAIIDDEPANLTMLRLLVRQMGCLPDQYGSATDFLEAAPQQDYDLIITDLSMPGMDGLELVDAVREGKGGAMIKHSWIIACTAHVYQQDEQQLIEKGFNGYLTKPLGLDALTEAVQAYLRDSRRA